MKKYGLICHFYDRKHTDEWVKVRDHGAGELIDYIDGIQELESARSSIIEKFEKLAKRLRTKDILWCKSYLNNQWKIEAYGKDVLEKNLESVERFFKKLIWLTIQLKFSGKTVAEIFEPYRLIEACSPDRKWYGYEYANEDLHEDIERKIDNCTIEGLERELKIKSSVRIISQVSADRNCFFSKLPENMLALIGAHSVVDNPQSLEFGIAQKEFQKELKRKQPLRIIAELSTDRNSFFSKLPKDILALIAAHSVVDNPQSLEFGIAQKEFEEHIQTTSITNH